MNPTRLSLAPAPAWARPRGVRTLLAVLAASLLLALWAYAVRATRGDWDPPFGGLGAVGFDPYWFGVAGLELALPVVLLLLLSRTALFRAAIGAAAQGDQVGFDPPWLLLALAAVQVAAILYQAAISRAIADGTMLAYFVVLAAALVGGWRMGLAVGGVAMVAIGAWAYLSWDWVDTFSPAEYVAYGILENLSAVVAVWVGFVAGQLFALRPPARRFDPGYALVVALLLHLGVALAVIVSYDDLGYYADRFVPGAVMTSLALVAVALMARDVQAEATRRAAESAALSLTQTERDLAQTQLALAQAELRALHAQINPHFFFNALNTIRYFIRTEPETARDLLTRLSEIFQRSLSAGDFVPLSEEISHVEAYLALEKARLDERLQVVWTNLAAEQLGQPVPTLILQPLVENAVIHGISPRTGGGTLHIVLNRVGDDLLIQVDDNGVGFDAQRLDLATPAPTAGDPASGRPAIGLRNVDSRLRRLYGSDYGLRLESRPEQGTRAVLRIPLDRSNGATPP